jgi:DNA-binding MarR family transcriptional regulator
MGIRMDKGETKRSTPNEMAILELLENSPKGFEELKKTTGLSRPVLSKHLKRLQKRGLIQRDPDTRKYMVSPSTRSDKLDYAVWESTAIPDVREAAKWVDRILELNISDKEKLNLLDRLLGASFHFLAANIALNISEAIQQKEPAQVQQAIEHLLDSYVAPYIQFLALYAHKHREKLGKWLEMIGSSFSHEGKHEFDIEEVLKTFKTIEKRG